MNRRYIAYVAVIVVFNLFFFEARVERVERELYSVQHTVSEGNQQVLRELGQWKNKSYAISSTSESTKD